MRIRDRGSIDLWTKGCRPHSSGLTGRPPLAIARPCPLSAKATKVFSQFVSVHTYCSYVSSVSLLKQV